MNCRFVLDVYNPKTTRHVEDYELQGLEFDEVLKVFDNKIENFVGKNPPPPHETMISWSERFGFEYKPETYSYGLGTYDK
jgi:hypothetical protein